jgi:hypothetical protein
VKSGSGGLQTSINIILAIALAVGVSWLADAVKGEALFVWLFGQSTAAGWGGLALSLLWTVGFGFWLYRRRATFLPTRHIHPRHEVAPHKVLIACVSNQRARVETDANGGIRIVFSEKRNGTEIEVPVALTGRLDLDKENPELSKRRWSWQQLLRGIAPHVSMLERVYLIGSAGRDGSFKDLASCEALLRKYCKSDTKIETFGEPIDFEDVGAVHGLLERAIKDAGKQGARLTDVIIDATGGQKTTSIAAAMATLRYPAVEFQYVQTAGPDVLAYNVVTAAQNDAL